LLSDGREGKPTLFYLIEWNGERNKKPEKKKKAAGCWRQFAPRTGKEGLFVFNIFGRCGKRRSDTGEEKRALCSAAF